VCIALLGSALALTAVGPHIVFDDYVLGLVARAEPAIPGLKQGRFDLFTFTTGSSSDNQALMDQGVMLPWWTDPQLAVGFFRPLSSLFHRLDYHLWPGAPKLMHLHTLVWLALLLAAAGRCYRRLESAPLLAGLATLLFAIDDTHAPTVAWLSNRNALIAATFSILAISAHDRARREGHGPSAGLGALYFLLALAAGEFGVAALGYLVAHALWLDPAPPARRLRGLLPYGAVLALWASIYASSGAAVRGSGSYASPLLEPLRFLSQFPARADCLLAAALGPLPSDLLFLGRPEHAMLWIVLGGLVLCVSAYAIFPELRRDRIARFWITGATLSVLPVTASFTGDRLLLLVSFGAMGLVARIIAPLFLAHELQSRRRRTLAFAFAGWHLGCAPLLLPLRAAQMQIAGRALDKANADWPAAAPNLGQTTVVIVNAPMDVFASYFQAERAWKRLSRPRHLHWLTSAGSPLHVTRTGARSLSVEREHGFLSTPLERHYRAQLDGLGPKSKVTLAEMRVQVERQTPDGRPLTVSLHFRDALESTSYLFLAWKRDRYQALTLPELGQSLHFPAEEQGPISLSSAWEML
jgi:hypothetical protein